jgi:nicotinamidase-related amidase
MIKNPALIIIDVQNGMFQGENPVYNGDRLISHLKTLIHKARTSDVPIFYIQHNAPVGKPLEMISFFWCTPEKNDYIKVRLAHTTLARMTAQYL